MNKDFTIVQANWTSQKDQLLAIRFQVFVDEQGVPKELEVDEQDENALHLMAIDDSQSVIGTARMLANGHIGRMAVSREQRGKGVGSALLEELILSAQQSGITQVFLNAQCTAEEFYRQAGFIPVGNIFEDAGIPHRKMVCQC